MQFYQKIEIMTCDKRKKSKKTSSFAQHTHNTQGRRDSGRDELLKCKYKSTICNASSRVKRACAAVWINVSRIFAKAR